MNLWPMKLLKFSTKYMDCSWILSQAILQFKANSCQTPAVSHTSYIAPSLQQKLFQTIFFYIQIEPSEMSMEPTLLPQKKGTCKAQWLGQALFRFQNIKSGCPGEVCCHLQKIWKPASLVKEQIDELSWEPGTADRMEHMTCPISSTHVLLLLFCKVTEAINLF